MKVYMKEKKNKQKDFLLLYTQYNNKLKYKVLLLLLQLIYKTTPPRFCTTDSFYYIHEVYSDILTGGYAVTTTIYSYIFCIYRYYNNILLVTLYD